MLRSREEGQCTAVARLLSTLRATEWGESFHVTYDPDSSGVDHGDAHGAPGDHGSDAAAHAVDEKRVAF